MINKASSQNLVAPVQTDLNSPGGNGGLLNVERDATESSTAAKFGDVLNRIQGKYGAKAEKPREIKKTLGKDDFLRIMMTQMKHQDPTNPFKAEQMATEMAQFTSVEQLQNLNQNFAKMTSQSQPLEKLAMTHLIGKIVTIDRDRFPHTEGQNESLNFTLPKDAKDVKVSVVSDLGEVVFDKDMGPMKAGEHNQSWEGMKLNSLPAKSGTYLLRVEAQDEGGQTMMLDSQKQARVIGVSFEGADPVFLVGDHQRQDKVTMRSIIRIESDGVTGSPGAPAVAGKMEKQPNFFTFQKGVGSVPIEQAQLRPDQAEALGKFEAKGFPHGLTETKEDPEQIVKGGE